MQGIHTCIPLALTKTFSIILHKRDNNSIFFYIIVCEVHVAQMYMYIFTFICLDLNLSKHTIYMYIKFPNN